MQPIFDRIASCVASIAINAAVVAGVVMFDRPGQTTRERPVPIVAREAPLLGRVLVTPAREQLAHWRHGQDSGGSALLAPAGRFGVRARPDALAALRESKLVPDAGRMT